MRISHIHEHENADIRLSRNSQANGKQVFRRKFNFRSIFLFFFSRLVVYWWQRSWLQDTCRYLLLTRLVENEIRNFVMSDVNTSERKLWNVRNWWAECVVVWCFLNAFHGYLLTMRLHHRKLSWLRWKGKAKRKSRTCWPLAQFI